MGNISQEIAAEIANVEETLENLRETIGRTDVWGRFLENIRGHNT
jgi:hypothetical protein